MAQLVAESGPLEGQVFPIEQGLTLGRAPHNTIPMPQNRKASRDHCKVWKDGAKSYAVADLGSTNGTLVNDAKILRTNLTDGDVIRIGEVAFRFEIGEEEKAKPKPPPSARPDLASVLEGKAPVRPVSKDAPPGGAASIEIKQRVLQYRKKGKRGSPLSWDFTQLAGPVRYAVILVALGAAVGLFLLAQSCTEKTRQTPEPPPAEAGDY